MVFVKCFRVYQATGHSSDQELEKNVSDWLSQNKNNITITHISQSFGASSNTDGYHLLTVFYTKNSS